MPRTAERDSTIHDVATLAGVSYQTVSRVVNRRKEVAPDTRQRVLDIIAQINYRPNLQAKGLRTHTTNLIGIIHFHSGEYGPLQILHHFQQEAGAHGYDVLMTALTSDQPAEILQAVDRLRQFRVDGIALLLPSGSTPLLGLRGPLPPLITLGNGNGKVGRHVQVDQQLGGKLATEHLIALGHREILHLRGPLGVHDAELRVQGYRQAMEHHALSLLPEMVGSWRAESGFTAMQQALAAGTSFSAVFAANDQMALGALGALRQAGRRVPQDVSVVGFDDTPESSLFEPPLTTIQQDVSALGREGMAVLLHYMQQPALAMDERVLQPRLIVRQTTSARWPTSQPEIEPR